MAQAPIRPASPALEGGVLASQHLRALIAGGAITATVPLLPAQVQPASLDLRLGSRAWRVRASFLPGARASVAERLRAFAMHEIDLSAGAVLETGCVYVVELTERLALPQHLRAAANAKSSTGRLDVFTRLITDYGTEFDRVEAGYHGPLYAEISPRTFSILVRAGSRLNQIRFRQGNAVYDDRTLQALQQAEGLVDGEVVITEGGVPFSVDLSGSGAVGWRAKRHAGLIDLDQVGVLDPADYWDPVFARPDTGLILDPDAFYILVSRESVRVPPAMAAEMLPYLAVAGEFRVHYAGFFDPGFGHSAAGGEGSRGVLEVRCHETPFALEHGQIVGRLVYEPMLAVPDVLYGQNGSNYQGQRLRLSKHFRSV